jgi:hypothetical protein
VSLISPDSKDLTIVIETLVNFIDILELATCMAHHMFYRVMTILFVFDHDYHVIMLPTKLPLFS